MSRGWPTSGICVGGCPTDEMHDPTYVANGADRCARCKTALMRARPLADDEDATVVLGVNVSDLGDYRPGQAAAAGAGAVFPFVEAGFTKDDIRSLVAELGPAHLGQASRRLPGLPPALRDAGDPRAPGRGRVAEAALRALGFGQLRVRHHGAAARLEFEPAALGEVIARREQVVPRCAGPASPSWPWISKVSARAV